MKVAKISPIIQTTRKVDGATSMYSFIMPPYLLFATFWEFLYAQLNFHDNV